MPKSNISNSFGPNASSPRANVSCPSLKRQVGNARDPGLQKLYGYAFPELLKVQSPGRRDMMNPSKNVVEALSARRGFEKPLPHCLNKAQAFSAQTIEDRRPWTFPLGHHGPQLGQASQEPRLRFAAASHWQPARLAGT